MPKTSMSIRRRFASLAAATALAGGLVTAVTAPAQAAPPMQKAPVASAAKASSYVFSGIFPDPVSCNIAGLLTGRSYVCNWSIFWWNLYVWQ